METINTKQDTSTIDQQILDYYRSNRRNEGMTLILEHYQNRLYNLAYRIISNYDDAMDILQEILIQIDKSIDGFKGQSSLYTWLYRLAVNVSHNYCQKEKKKKGQLLFNVDELNQQMDKLKADENNPEKLCEEGQKRLILQKAVSMLPENQKTAIILHDLEGFTSPQIAEILEVSGGSVKSRINRGRESLKKILSAGIDVQGSDKTGIHKFDFDGSLI